MTVCTTGTTRKPVPNSDCRVNKKTVEHSLKLQTISKCYRSTNTVLVSSHSLEVIFMFGLLFPFSDQLVRKKQKSTISACLSAPMSNYSSSVIYSDILFHKLPRYYYSPFHFPTLSFCYQFLTPLP